MTNGTTIREVCGPAVDHGASALSICAGRGTIVGASRPVGLSLTRAGAGYRIAAIARDGTPLVELGAFEDDDVIAIWRSLASASGLPLLLAGDDGVLVAAQPQIGRLAVGPSSQRRRLAVLSGRRPRFLARRKAARLPGLPVIYREKEIATGRGS